MTGRDSNGQSRPSALEGQPLGGSKAKPHLSPRLSSIPSCLPPSVPRTLVSGEGRNGHHSWRRSGWGLSREARGSCAGPPTSLLLMAATRPCREGLQRPLVDEDSRGCQSPAPRPETKINPPLPPPSPLSTVGPIRMIPLSPSLLCPQTLTHTAIASASRTTSLRPGPCKNRSQELPPRQAESVTLCSPRLADQNETLLPGLARGLFEFCSPPKQ